MEYNSRKADFYALTQQKYNKQVWKTPLVVSCKETCFLCHEQGIEGLGKIISSGGNKKQLLYSQERAGYSAHQSGKLILIEEGSMMLVYYVFTLNWVSLGYEQPQDLEI